MKTTLISPPVARLVYWAVGTPLLFIIGMIPIFATMVGFGSYEVSVRYTLILHVIATIIIVAIKCTGLLVAFKRCRKNHSVGTCCTQALCTLVRRGHIVSIAAFPIGSMLLLSTTRATGVSIVESIGICLYVFGIITYKK